MNIRRIFSIGLAALLQVLPLTRAFVAVTPAAGSSYAIIATWIAGAAALLGGIDAVSGASTTITSAKTATATNGVAFSYRITTGPDVANTFAATPLPAGLTVATSSGRITGTPTVTGVYVIHLTASDNGRVDRTVTADLTLTILAGGGTSVVAPSITTQPISQTVTAGANVSFVVAASGTAPLGYQWRLNGGNVSGATNATLTLSSVTTGQSGGSYTCVVSNSAGTATSSAAVLTVNPAVVAPSITTQPISQTVTAGANVSFVVAASGTAPLGYQWLVNGTNLSGATTATLTVNAVMLAQNGFSYSCLVTNAAGSATSSVATLTVAAAAIAPTVTSAPSSQTVTAGANVTFNVGVNGTAPLSYQWWFNAAPLSGANNATLTLTSVTTNQAGSYSCFVSNSAGSVTSAAATLTVNPAPVAPSITTQPSSQTVLAGTNVSFNIAASGTAPLSFQWRLNGAAIGGATSATLTLTGVATNQSGGYSCVVSNMAGVATSSTATLTVNPLPVAPTITIAPTSQTVTAGANVSFSVAASGTAPMSYQWRLNGVNISGATAATLALTSVTTNQSGGSYSCFVSNVAGAVISSAASLTVNAALIPPTITVQPVSQTVTAGGNVSFSAAASGSAPLSYQWRLNGVNLGGATGATLNLTSVTTNQAGSYTCMVSNGAGTASSGAAVLTVNPAVSEPSKLTVSITGQGTVSPNLNGMALTVGKVYTLSALPAAGYTFSGWSAQYQQMSASTTISFVMTSNLVLTALFTADPRVAAAGTYNGLFYQSDEVRLAAAGAFNLRADAAGNFSAWVQIGYSRYSFSGTLDANLQATATAARWDGTPLTVSFTIGQGAAAGQMVGTVSDGVWTAALSGGRNLTSTGLAGDYTVVFTGTAGNAALPAGDGYATLHVAADGLGTMSGTLADGTAFAQTAYVTADSEWPLYVSLYSGKGAIVSWLTFTNLTTSDMNGDLVWIKQAGASIASYSAGFTNGSKVVGSRYVAPPGTGKAIELSGAILGFSGGSLASAFNNVISINAGSQVVNLGANALTMTISPATGLFTGQVSEPGNGNSHKFGGVILQKQNAGYGTMTGSPTSSRVVLAAP